jgi:hypothetical protein
MLNKFTERQKKKLEMFRKKKGLIYAEMMVLFGEERKKKYEEYQEIVKEEQIFIQLCIN